MGHYELFRALSSKTRLNMLKILLKEEMHISALAKKLKISVPVVSKHVRILENAGFVKRKKYGRSHVIKANDNCLYNILEAFTDIDSIELSRGNSALEALKLISAVNTKKINDKEFLISIDGKEGYYIYEVDDRFADISMDDYKFKTNVELKLKKLIPVTEKVIKIKMR